MFIVLKEVDIILKKQVFKKNLVIIIWIFIFQDAVTICCIDRVQHVKKGLFTKRNNEYSFILKLIYN